MCCLASRPMQEGERCKFIIELRGPLQGSAVVEALVRWVKPAESYVFNLGVAFLESSKGWLGPEENDLPVV